MLEVSEPLNVWLVTRDLEAARRFYAEQLGLQLWREEPGRALHFGFGGGVLSVHTAEDGNLPPRGSSILFTVAGGIDEVCADLARHGVAFEQPLADRRFGRSAMFRDPDGHELWICQPSAAETQFDRWRQSRRVRTRRVALKRPMKVRRHEPKPVSHRPAHPTSL
jgi:catechol 2,3-dioxygenase-like lactoylglutathione lyase family enzyme